MAAAMAVEAMRRREERPNIPIGSQMLYSRQPTPEAPAASAGRPGDALAAALMDVDQMSPRDRREARNAILSRTAVPERRPTGRDVLAIRADAMLQQSLAALEQGRQTGALSQPDFERERGRLLRHYMGMLGANNLQDEIADRLPER